ncbi:MAG: large conductance mechanosensitive channel protein MscL [Hydrogenophilales bacterium CG03_land_8_20_14_0_80_62_28]|nr:MAG: large conductance mechanosensitive channel protein MscL [Hydrogenophilales bacterium CG03_land_8_20_14_0_80_62_28]PIW72898.1 MAG: large conductance mechanosensitive channel protein MscL [Hydrogenophilales bacterium CG12_big_fil_rev_8_21_14_0_65_61_21]PIX00651.1 MAG: large conductance mechanosensitive channel protein MscL [Hydrogenophilales bacterium CG_4_8_14_3_um_filter_62_83]PIY98120.1 MAG: large conductance mechanosensitive channel protein MscL [Hydrogenophilales bacterium CG_4_10_14_
MSMMQEFKEFAMRGNVVDMAVGVVIGSAFGKIVDSLVKDVIMPPIGLMMGGVDFSQLYINLSDIAYESLAAAEKAGAPLIKYGMFINTMINFVIIAFVIFMLIKGINRMKREQPAAQVEAPPTPEDIILLREIRDSLNK